jgi:hypothetical protein
MANDEDQSMGKIGACEVPHLHVLNASFSFTFYSTTWSLKSVHHHRWYVFNGGESNGAVVSDTISSPLASIPLFLGAKVRNRVFRPFLEVCEME